MKRILVTEWIPEDAVEGCADCKFTMPAVEQGEFSNDEIVARVADHDGLLTLWQSIGRDVIDAGVSLKAIATNSVGFDHVDVAYAASKGIPVVNTPRAVTDPTAELTLALLLDVARGVSYFDRRTRASGSTEKPGKGDELFSSSTTPSGKTLGIVGFGRIGREVARKARAALGMKIIYHNTSPIPPEVERELDARRASFDELLEQADFVSVHCPYRPSNHHLFGAEQFARMKRTAYFINMARGKVMDEAALVRALDSGEIAGAALDVYEDEPNVSPALLTQERAVLAPHIGTHTRESFINMLREALSGLREAMDGGEPYNLVRL